MKAIFTLFAVSQMLYLGSAAKHEVDWKYGMTPWERCINPGDEVVFVWSSGFHNVEQVKASEFEKCEGFTGEGANGEDEVSFAINKSGIYYLVCGVGDHCSDGGMKAIIRVGNC